MDLFPAGTPLGPLDVVVEGGRVVRVGPGRGEDHGDPRLVAEVRAQLAAYLDGRRRSFDLPTGAVGTPFQRAVWDAVTAVPYGDTRGYGELAASFGAAGKARAVGAALGANPLLVVVPCHRVVGAGGGATGYAAGVGAKLWLLGLESDVVSGRRR